MVKIRLTRLGKHKDPFYRIVAIDYKSKRDGGYLALLGTYEPFSGKANLRSEEILKFLKNGAQASETCLNLFKAKGLYKTFLEGKKKPTKKAKKNRKSKRAKEKNKARAERKAKAAANRANAKGPQPKVEKPAEQPKAEAKPAAEVKKEETK